MTKKLIDVDDKIWNYVKAYAELKDKNLANTLDEIIRANPNIIKLMEINDV